MCGCKPSATTQLAPFPFSVPDAVPPHHSARLLGHTSGCTGGSRRTCSQAAYAVGARTRRCCVAAGFVYVDGGENDGDAAFTPIPQQDKVRAETQRPCLLALRWPRPCPCPCPHPWPLDYEPARRGVLLCACGLCVLVVLAGGAGRECASPLRGRPLWGVIRRGCSARRLSTRSSLKPLPRSLPGTCVVAQIKEAYTLLKKPKKARKAHPLFARGFDTKLSLRVSCGQAQKMRAHPLPAWPACPSLPACPALVARRVAQPDVHAARCHAECLRAVVYGSARSKD